MRKSQYSDQDKFEIINDIITSSKSINEGCIQHKISIATYYAWKRQLKNEFKHISSLPTKPENEEKLLKTENSTLRKLYINLSAHNYELAQFLEKL